MLIIIRAKFSQNRRFCWRKINLPIKLIVRNKFFTNKTKATQFEQQIFQKNNIFCTETQSLISLRGYRFSTWDKGTNLHGLRRVTSVPGGGVASPEGPYSGPRDLPDKYFFFSYRNLDVTPVPSSARSFCLGSLTKEYGSYSLNESDARWRELYTANSWSKF